MYDNNLLANIDDLIARMKSQAYKPQPVRRVYIPKPGSDDKRPLGIPSYCKGRAYMIRYADDSAPRRRVQVA